ncbi:MAG: hypothetical protein HQK55_16990, partial [Deltaproteobacteria bacterium]|nr:hypothetical protein [Deltaproteobacteria bacterium]
VLGQNVSLDSKMVDVKAQKIVSSMSAQSQGMDGVIPKVNEFAADINSRVFGRQAGEKPVKAQTTAQSKQPVDANAPGRRHPDTLLMGREGQKLNSSPLNPNFISAVGADEREGAFWRGPSFPAAVVGMDIGDVDGDGKNEIAYCTRNTVYVSRVIGAQIDKVAAYEGISSDKFLSLDVLDTNRSGKAKIFVSNQRRDQASSLVLEVRGKELVPIVQDSPWYFRVINTSAGPKLIGQRGGSGERFYGGVYYMREAGGQFTPEQEISLPTGFNIFNFAILTAGAANKEYIVGVNDRETLVVTPRGGGKEIWKSKDDFAQTMNYMEEAYGNDPTGVVRGDTDPKWIFIPSRVLVADLIGDGRKECIVARNIKSGTSFLPRLRGFEKGSIYSLSLVDQMVRENWRSRDLPGFAADYQIKDYNNTGRPSLVVAVVVEYGTGLFDARSAIAAYELASPEEMKAMRNKREVQE